MNSLTFPEVTKYVIAHNGSDIYHYNIVEPQNCFRTGQPFMEVFSSEEEAKQAFPQAFPLSSVEMEEQMNFINDHLLDLNKK